MFKYNLLRQVEGEPNPEKLGKNVEIRLIFARHGEKDMNDREKGLLTEKGKIEFREFAETELQDSDRTLVVYGTDIDRTVQSGLEAVANAESRVKVYPQPLSELSLNVGSVDSRRPQKFSRAFMNKMKGLSPGDNVSQYLTYHDQKPDEGTVSPRELASGIAKIIIDYHNKAKRFKSDSKTDVLLVSHDFVLRSFLQEFLAMGLTEGKRNLDTAEFFEVLIKTNEKGEAILEFKYAGQSRILNLADLQELTSQYEKN